MGIKIKSIIESVEDNGIKILVHGLAGAGKTVMCATAGAKTLLISAEGGLLSLKGSVEEGLLPEEVYDLVDVLEVHSLEELIEAYEYAKIHPEYEWIALDSISEIGETILEYEKGFSKDPRAAYGNLITEMTSVLKKFRDIPNKNVIMSCKQQRIVDGDTEQTMYVPSMPGAKLHQAIPYLFDEVFALRVEKDDDGDDYRVVQTNRDLKYEAKDRSCKLDMFEEPSLYSIMKKINSGKKAKVEEVEEELPEGVTQEMVDEVSESIDAMDAETEIETPFDEEAETEEVISEKNQYWYHSLSDSAIESEKGDDISKLLSDPDVEEITKVKFTKLMKEKKEHESV